MELENKKVWLIMTKCRKFIAKGTPRNRELISVDDKKDKKRFLTYSSKGMAESAFKTSGFSTWRCKEFPYDNSFGSDRTEYLEAVECSLVLNVL
jgi:hypothetical protein